MLLWHGTTEKYADHIRKNGIDLRKSRSQLDFGPGFYMTNEVGLAERTARHKTLRENSRFSRQDRAAVISFQVDESAFKNLCLKKFNFSSSKWLEYVILNRLRSDLLTLTQLQVSNHDGKYDLSIGPTADGSVANDVYAIGKSASSGGIVIERDLYRRFLPSMGEQYAFHTEKSLTCIDQSTCDIILLDIEERS